jgi:hypothetical protein
MRVYSRQPTGKRKAMPVSLITFCVRMAGRVRSSGQSITSSNSINRTLLQWTGTLARWQYCWPQSSTHLYEIPPYIPAILHDAHVTLYILDAWHHGNTVLGICYFKFCGVEVRLSFRYVIHYLGYCMSPTSLTLMGVEQSMKWFDKEIQDTRVQSDPVPCCMPQITHNLTKARTQATERGSSE